jgi:hypothetical protein
MKRGATPPTDGPKDEATGLPRLSTWRSVYLLVVVLFILYVVFMVALSKGFA